MPSSAPNPVTRSTSNRRDKPPTTRFNEKAINVWTARVIPVVLVAILGYASWVVVDLVAVQYLLRPPSTANHGPRPALAVIILVLYFALLFPVLVTFGRLLFTIVSNPGLVPRGPQWEAQHRATHTVSKPRHRHLRGTPRTSNSSASQEKSSSLGGPYSPTSLGNGPLYSTSRSAPAVLDDFWKRDVFVCEPDGRPRWCSTCQNVKGDRVHHCSEIDRCVRKMDHFCPWVGGIISENGFKFFIQFVSYAAVFCVFALGFMARFVYEMDRGSQPFNIHFVFVLAMAGLFSLFNVGMAGSSIQLALRNLTTVENLTRTTKVWHLAIYLPLSIHNSQHPPDPTIPRITYPLTPRPPISPSSSSAAAAPSFLPTPRTFLILSTRPGESPFHLGSPLANWTSVMGSHVIDWFSPVRHSPCVDHSSTESAYETGPAVRRLKREVGLFDDGEAAAEPSERKDRRRRRRKRRDTEGHGVRYGHRS